MYKSSILNLLVLPCSENVVSIYGKVVAMPSYHNDVQPAILSTTTIESLLLMINHPPV